MSTIAAGITSGTALVSTGNTDGTLQLQVNGTTPSVTLAANGSIGVGSTPGYGTNGQVLTSAGSAAAPTWATPSAGGLTLGTPVDSTSGTAINFTGIPAGTKQVIVNFRGVTSSSTGNLSLQLGTSGGLATSGYNGQAAGITTSGPGSFSDNDTTLFKITATKLASAVISGSVVCILENSTTNIWVISGLLSFYNSGNGAVYVSWSTGYVTLSSVLTQLSIKALGDSFSQGQINIAYA